jgi:hypothetical protein
LVRSGVAIHLVGVERRMNAVVVDAWRCRHLFIGNLRKAARLRSGRRVNRRRNRRDCRVRNDDVS